MARTVLIGGNDGIGRNDGSHGASNGAPSRHSSRSKRRRCTHLGGVRLASTRSNRTGTLFEPGGDQVSAHRYRHLAKEGIDLAEDLFEYYTIAGRRLRSTAPVRAENGRARE